VGIHTIEIDTIMTMAGGGMIMIKEVNTLEVEGEEIMK